MTIYISSIVSAKLCPCSLDGSFREKVKESKSEIKQQKHFHEYYITYLSILVRVKALKVAYLYLNSNVFNNIINSVKIL